MRKWWLMIVLLRSAIVLQLFICHFVPVKYAWMSLLVHVGPRTDFYNIFFLLFLCLRRNCDPLKTIRIYIYDDACCVPAHFHVRTHNKKSTQLFCVLFPLFALKIHNKGWQQQHKKKKKKWKWLLLSALSVLQRSKWYFRNANIYPVMMLMMYHQNGWWMIWMDSHTIHSQ